ncbi:MAG: META domain-containing protein [Cyanobacteria bacterium]|nr:META domain-containing protein [Cyanobacteriota bacterium]
MTLQPAAHLAVLLVASQLLAPAVWAGQLSGTARLQQPIALPPDAVLEVVLIDAAIADAPARVLGRTRISPPGQGPLGRLPASWRGELPNAGGSTLWQVDLAADGSYQLRQTWLNRPAPNTFDDIGRWRLEPSGQRLVLRGGREAPVFLQPLQGGAVLRKLDLEGQPIRSGHNDRLQRLAVPEPISPRLFLAGLFRLLPQGPTIQLCMTGQRLPVALEGDYKRLLQAYRSAVPASGPGQPLLVSLKGLISQRPAAQPGQGPRRTLVVEAFGRAHPGQGCPQPQMAFTPMATSPMASDQNPAPAHRAQPTLRGIAWKLQALQAQDGPTLINPPCRPPELLLATGSERLSGNSGCNRLLGGFQLAGDQLRFSQLVSTKMACALEVMAFEQQYLKALDQVRQWNIDKRSLLLQDGVGRSLLLYRL